MQRWNGSDFHSGRAGGCPAKDPHPFRQACDNHIGLPNTGKEQSRGRRNIFQASVRNGRRYKGERCFSVEGFDIRGKATVEQGRRRKIQYIYTRGCTENKITMEWIKITGGACTLPVLCYSFTVSSLYIKSRRLSSVHSSNAFVISSISALRASIVDSFLA